MSRFYLNESYIPKIIRLLGAGLSQRDIAEEVGFSEETVCKFIKKHGLKEGNHARQA